MRPLLLLLVLGFVGCATFKETEIAQFRQLGVSPALIAKLEHRRPLLPDDLVDLKRAHVRDDFVVRHVDRVGVNYIATREDIVMLRKAGVGSGVIDALLHESDRFAAFQSYDNYRDYDTPPFSPFYSDWVFGRRSGFY